MQKDCFGTHKKIKHERSCRMIQNNKTFDVLRTICEVVLPALSAAYFALSEIWGYPFIVPEKICGTIAVVITFLGAFINAERSNYNKLQS